MLLKVLLCNQARVLDRSFALESAKFGQACKVLAGSCGSVSEATLSEVGGIDGGCTSLVS